MSRSERTFFARALVAALALAAAEPAPGVAQAPRVRFSGGLELATVYDSNLDHQPNAAAGMSMAGLGDLGMRYTGRQLALQLSYRAAHYRYDGNPERNRTTHDARAVLTLAPASRFVLSATLEGSFGGLSEDREPGSQYGISPRLEIRPSDRNRIRFHTLHRVRQFGQLSGRDVVNHGGGVDYRIGARGQPALELGTRYDRTLTDDQRSQFNRWTQRVTFTAPIGSATTLTLGAYQTTRVYPRRFVELEPLADLELLPAELRLLEGYTREPGDAAGSPFADVPADQLLRWRDLPRRDEIWAPTAGLLVRAFGLDMRLGYELEIRLSNDLRRGYTAHAVTFGSRWAVR